MSGNKIRQLGLGTDMRELRLRSGMSTRAVADKLGVSRMSLHRTEAGKRTVPAEEIIAMCAIYGVTGRDRERLVERATRGDNDASWLAAGPAFNDQFRSFVALEKQASRFTHVSMLLVPGLLQTPDYIRAIVDDVSEADSVLATRLARQELLTQPGAPNFAFMIDELALWRRIADESVMADQLAHLVNMNSCPNIAIRIIPQEAGAHAGISGTFILLDLPDAETHVYLESIKTGVLLSKLDEHQQFIDAVAKLSDSALSEDRSTELIKSAQRELSHA